jgi:hypothetical protein
MNTISREGAAFGSASKHSGTNYATSSGRGKESKLPKDCAIRRWLAVLFPAGSSAYLGPQIKISDSVRVKRALIFIPNI